ncbi:hypothetical protein JOE11_005484 [Robbsia andropogonis]|uniref:hypothetical protein n=1 Tax=Robbsia andropogonis TaxID=28092 RepID=UPI003D1FDC95
MSLTIADFPQAMNESKSVDFGEGVTGTLTLIDYNGDVPIFSLSVDGEMLFTGTAEQVIAQAAYYRKHRAIGQGQGYKLVQRVKRTPFGDRTDSIWVLVDYK